MKSMRKFLLVSLISEVILGLLIGGYFLYFRNDFKVSKVELPKPKPKAEVLPEKVTFIIGGDAMLGRAVASQFNNDVMRAFENLGENFFSGKDIGIINLEGPINSENITPNPTPDNLVFNFPRNAIDALKYLGVNGVSLANNHSRNQGKSGLETTQILLKENNIIPIGEQLNYGVERFGKGKKKLAIVTINLLEDDADISQVIKDEKTAGNWVLVFPHFGSEYQETHNQSQEKSAHAWIDAGADIVIGSHPHVVQDAEIYNNKPIFYSLGNLIFDQTFSTPTQEGLIIVGEIEENILKLELLPTKIRNLKVELASSDERAGVVNSLKENLGFDTNNQENVIDIQITSTP